MNGFCLVILQSSRETWQGQLQEGKVTMSFFNYADPKDALRFPSYFHYMLCPGCYKYTLPCDCCARGQELKEISGWCCFKSKQEYEQGLFQAQREEERQSYK